MMFLCFLVVLCWVGTYFITFAKKLGPNCDFHLFCNAMGRKGDMFLLPCNRLGVNGHILYCFCNDSGGQLAIFLRIPMV